VQENVGEMRPSGVQAIKLVIELVREGDERIPQTKFFGEKSPGDSISRETLRRVGIFIHVTLVIIVDELEVYRRSINEEDEGDE
jgi:hypothetical protein